MPIRRPVPGLARAAAAVPIALLALGAAGCGDRATGTDDQPPASSASPSASPSSTEPSVRPASGARLERPAFAVRIPKGWADVTERRGDVVLRAAQTTADEVPGQLVVTHDDATGEVFGLQDAALAELKRSGHVRLRAGEPVRIAGREASRVTAVQPVRGAPLAVVRYDVVASGAHWAVTFAASRWLNPEDRARVVESVLTTWEWR